MIAENLQRITESLPKEVQLIAVSKYHPEEEVMEAYRAGARQFGENIVQELRRKQQALPSDIGWHFIGHLQSNKIKYIAPFVSLIHSVDSGKLLEEIDRHAARCGRVIPCLLQLHVAKEETKFGFTLDECRQWLDKGDWKALAHVDIRGLMCMASNVDDEDQIREEFHQARQFFDEIKEHHFADRPQFTTRSWGMSSDYRIAIAEGSNMVRIGSDIFGARTYIH